MPPVLDFCEQKHLIVSCLTSYLKIRTLLTPDGLKTFALKYWKIGNYFPFFPFLYFTMCDVTDIFQAPIRNQRA